MGKEIIDGMLKEQLFAAYYTLRGLIRNLEVILCLDAKTPNQDEARALKYFREHDVDIMDVVKAYKIQAH